MSSFKRATPKAPGASLSQSGNSGIVEGGNRVVTGVKPWVQTGLGIVSTANKQLDDLVGGGVALGTITLIESDGFSNYGETLALYQLGEAISHQHATLLIAEDKLDAERLLSTIPYNQTVSTYDAVDTLEVDTVSDVGKLTIAWQYAKYIKHTGVASFVASPLAARLKLELFYREGDKQAE
jgi:hypothetical protein